MSPSNDVVRYLVTERVRRGKEFHRPYTDGVIWRKGFTESPTELYYVNCCP